jgi:murein DD-endopeptidase MepM/ murein hydrolase activator NlpD
MAARASVALALVLGLSALAAGPATGKTRFTYVFPVVGHSGYAHKHSEYPASDIIAACGLPVVAAVDGVVLEVSRDDPWSRGIKSGATRGGLFVSIRGDDGVRYYGSHMSKVKRGIEAGLRVHAGQEIGKVGRTGRAGACHLHFGISPICAGTGDWWIRRGVIWPWPYLDTWKSASIEDRSPRKEIASWSAANGCPSAPAG